MKKIFALVLCFCLMFSFNVFADTTVTPEREYEIWTQSPYLTCGLTDEDVRIYKAYELNALEMIPLTELGDRYYLAACQDKNKDGGYNGKTETSGRARIRPPKGCSGS